jgi:hypothetical protein
MPFKLIKVAPCRSRQLYRPTLSQQTQVALQDTLRQMTSRGVSGKREHLQLQALSNGARTNAWQIGTMYVFQRDFHFFSADSKRRGDELGQII